MKFISRANTAYTEHRVLEFIYSDGVHLLFYYDSVTEKGYVHAAFVPANTLTPDFIHNYPKGVSFIVGRGPLFSGK